MTDRKRKLAYLVALAAMGALALTTPAYAQEQKQKQQEQKQDEEKEEEEDDEDDYEELLKEHEADEGVFIVHRKEQSLFFEIPPDMLGRDFVWVTELRQTPSGGYAGTSAGDRLVRWEKLGGKILLRAVTYEARASGDDPRIKRAVENSNTNPIIEAFDIEAESPDGNYLIDVDRFFMSDPDAFEVREEVGGGGPDSGRTFLNDATSFPDNINVTTLYTFSSGSEPASPFGGGNNDPAKTALVHYSIALLPVEPMMGRLHDERVGFFSVGFTDYGTDEAGVEELRYVTRYRLEKKNPDAAISDPVEPIVYYISPEVPEKWRTYVKQGVEDWQVAFEAAGFSNAIIAKDPPTEEEDPDWSPEDARYSVIRWAPLPIANAMGPHVHDPRSGEIISAHIIMWHDVLRLGAEWYFAQAAAIDERAQHIPMPEELIGEQLRFVVAHEVGHTLGLQHNGKGSSSISIEQLRDDAWTSANGTASSIMDYARFNYVAQPGDGVTDAIPKVGPYDKFAIMWGYTPLPRADTPAEEEPTLDKWAEQHASDPKKRYGGFSGSDPTSQSEDLSNDTVAASRLGLANLKRIMGFVWDATVEPDRDFEYLDQYYGSLISQYNREIGHVVQVVGGQYEVTYHAAAGKPVYEPVPGEYQQEAVLFLMENAVEPQLWLAPERIADVLSADGGMSRITSAQDRAIFGLLSDARLLRMLQFKQQDQPNPYTVQELLVDLRDKVWAGVQGPAPVYDLYERSAQRSLVNALIAKLPNTSSELRAHAIGELRAEAVLIRKAIPKAGDRVTALHLDDLRRIIEDALTPD